MSRSAAPLPTITVGDVLEDCVLKGAVVTGGEIYIETDDQSDYNVGDKVRNVEAGSYRKGKKINQTVASSVEATQGQFAAQPQAEASFFSTNQANDLCEDVTKYRRIGNHTFGLRSWEKLIIANMGSAVCVRNLKGSLKSETNYVGDGKEEDNSRHNRNSDNEKTVSNMGNVVAVGKVGGGISHKLNATVISKREK